MRHKKKESLLSIEEEKAEGKIIAAGQALGGG